MYYFIDGMTYIYFPNGTSSPQVFRFALQHRLGGQGFSRSDTTHRRAGSTPCGAALLLRFALPHQLFLA